MFQGFTDETFEFFMAIRFNNNRDFFHANHDWYMRAVREPALALAAALSEVIEGIDPDLERRPERVVSRINRDLRFSNDKTPYRDYMWLGFHRQDALKHSELGFYVDMGADALHCGMGFYERNRPRMAAIRREVLRDPAPLARVLPGEGARLRFCPEVYRRAAVPEQVPPDMREWCRLKSFYYEREFADFALVKSACFADAVAETYAQLTPLYRYVNALQPVAEDTI